MDNVYLIFVDKLSTHIMIAWDKFLFFALRELGSPVLTSILKKTNPIREDGNMLVVEADNQGSRLLLENKKEVIQELLSVFNNHPTKLVITLKEKKRKAPVSSLPLISYQDSPEAAFSKANLNPLFNFENFAVSNSNQIAHAASYAVATNPGKQYNPLFLYGGVGVGKTHLMHAIGQKILADSPDKKVLYCTSEEFTNDLIELIRRKNTGQFRNKYRTLDVLLIDDIQFIAGKTYIQEELYHTFNTMVRLNHQIVFTSDKSPKEISGLEDRLRSRFSGGLMIDVQKPDFELRCAIVMIKAKQRNIPIDIMAVKTIAEKIEDSRELEGMILNIYSKSLLLNNTSQITNDLATYEIKTQKETRIKKTTASDVIKTVCVFYDIKQSYIKSPIRKDSIARARQTIMYILRIELKMKYEEIAFLLKRKDHTTIMHGVDKIKNEIMTNDRINDEIQRIINSL